jgi:Rps23 Pro-64 3,4-dihydroxylase Tpa1-like proline 4-hydroxylase
MEFINLTSLYERLDLIKKDYHAKKPFKYILFDGILYSDKAELIEKEYPSIKDGKWDGATYVDQKNKFQKTTFEKGSLLERVFMELNSSSFLEWLQQVTDVKEKLIADSELFGGGLHQSIRGAFLNVHVDYNYHPKTKFHRRLNVLIYLNKDWKDEYEGHLELWDLSGSNKLLLNKIAPTYNRCVIFETNEISYHGHPKPLNTPLEINRKSLAIYYYSETRPESELTLEHNTVYVNTEGLKGMLNRLRASLKAIGERILR